jgi:hypothetical protein
MSECQAVESHGTPHIDTVPVDLPSQGPACDNRVITCLTDADIEARETLQVLRPAPETDDERLVRYWFCLTGYHTEFVEAVANGECEETLYDD